MVEASWQAASVRPRQRYNTEVGSFSATIAAALFAFFRNRGADALPAVLDQEGKGGWVFTTAKEGRGNDSASGEEALLTAQEEASFREAGERIPMYDPPGRQLAVRMGPAPRMSRGFGTPEKWTPWVSTNHLCGISGLEAFDPELYKQLCARPAAARRPGQRR